MLSGTDALLRAIALHFQPLGEEARLKLEGTLEVDHELRASGKRITWSNSSSTIRKPTGCIRVQPCTRCSAAAPLRR